MAKDGAWASLFAFEMDGDASQGATDRMSEKQLRIFRLRSPEATCAQDDNGEPSPSVSRVWPVSGRLLELPEEVLYDSECFYRSSLKE
jgi:hypothetical protein